MPGREECCWWVGGALSIASVLIIGIGHYVIKYAEIEYDAKIQIVHEINVGLTNFGQGWSWVNGNTTKVYP